MAPPLPVPPRRFRHVPLQGQFAKDCTIFPSREKGLIALKTAATSPADVTKRRHSTIGYALLAKPMNGINAPQRPDCVAGPTGLEPLNGVANYPFEMSHEFLAIQLN